MQLTKKDYLIIFCLLVFLIIVVIISNSYAQENTLIPKSGDNISLSKFDNPKSQINTETNIINCVRYSKADISRYFNFVIEIPENPD